MKRIISTITVLLFLLIPTISYGATPPPFDDSNLSVVSAMLIDAKTGEVLYEKGGDEKISPASTTKLITALLTVENRKMDDIVVPGKEVYDFSSASSLANIQSGENITVKDLLYGLLLASGNDAAAALAVDIGGSLEGFNDMMNARAKELGMENTYFSNPHGLVIKDKEHYSTAKDMAKLALAAYSHPELMEIMGTKQYTIQPTNKMANPRDLKNSNLLLLTPETKPEYAPYLYEYATGMKTGLIQNPWYGCLVASAQRGDLEFIAMVFGDSSDRGINRWQNVIDMFNYGFTSCSKADLSKFIAPVTDNQTIDNCAKNDPEEGAIVLTTEFDDSLPRETYLSPETVEGLNDGTLLIEQETVYTKPMVAPVSKGEEMGYVRYSLQGEEVYRAPIKADREVYQLGEEQLTKEEYDLPGFVFNWEWWYLAIIIPAVAVAGLFIFRAYNLKKARRRPSPRRIGVNSNQNNNNERYRGRKL